MTSLRWRVGPEVRRSRRPKGQEREANQKSSTNNVNPKNPLWKLHLAVKGGDTVHHIIQLLVG